MENEVQEILSIMARMKDNHFANFNVATHVIFNDNNIGKQHLISALQDVDAWKAALRDSLDDNWMPETLHEDLKDIAETITALLELSEFSDNALDNAMAQLNPE